MDAPRDWLWQTCTQAAAASSPRASLHRARAGRAVAALHYRRAGLAYGLPVAPEAKVTAIPGRVVAFVAGMVGYAAALGHDDPAAVTLRAFAAVYDKASASLSQEGDAARRNARVGEALLRRTYLAGNPVVGLTLAHAFLACDAQSVRSVLDGGRAFSEERVRAERTASIMALARLTQEREDLPPDMVRRVYTWQLGGLAAGRSERAAWVQLALEPPPFDEAVRRTRMPDAFFPIVAISAALDGRVSEEEAHALWALGRACGMSRARVHRERRRALDFHVRHRDALDPLAAAAAATASARRAGLPWRTVVGVVAKNGRALVREIRETGDLAVLLARRGAGQPLGPAETERMRAQLVDVAKAVPSLAVLTLPGGLFLLPLLAKLLPFELLPSAFHDEGDPPFEVFESSPSRTEETPFPPSRTEEKP